MPQTIAYHWKLVNLTQFLHQNILKWYFFGKTEKLKSLHGLQVDSLSLEKYKKCMILKDITPELLTAGATFNLNYHNTSYNQRHTCEHICGKFYKFSVVHWRLHFPEANS